MSQIIGSCNFGCINFSFGWWWYHYGSWSWNWTSSSWLRWHIFVIFFRRFSFWLGISFNWSSFWCFLYFTCSFCFFFSNN